MLLPERTGELAALATACCWTVTALAFESAGRRVGSLPVNLIRLVVALGLLAITEQLRRGIAWPVDAPPAAWLWLGLSGLIGFAFGDLCLFRAFVEIGSRLSLLLMALAPIFAAIFSFAALGDRLDGRDILGMAVTLAGVAWVVLERRPGGRAELPPPTLRGILLGIGGALGQGGGLVLSKVAVQSYPPLPANQIRIMAGIVGFLVIFAFSGQWRRLGAAFRDGHAMGRTFVGAVFGPFLGVSLSLFAVRDTSAGVAATIMGLTPVLILPIVVLRKREPVSVRATGGAVLAVAGTALLFS